MSDSLALRKARGAYFTPPELSQFITAWAIRSDTDRILEPSCGDAAFLIPAAARLHALDPGSRTQFQQLVGVDIHAASAAEAERRLAERGFAAEIRIADFFDVMPERVYDAVIGNPPYVRYQEFAGANRAKSLAAALSQGVRLNGLASSWAAFTVHATRFLKPDGRLGLVLPAELLTVNYAAEVRRFLLNRFRTVRLVLFEARVFPEVMEDVVLLLAEGEGPSPHFEVFQAADLSSLDGIEAGGWTWFSPDKGGKWTPALLSTTAVETYRSTSTGNGFTTLLEWGDTSLGSVTGNNNFFTLSADEARSLGVRANELHRISPPGSRHLRGLSFTANAWESLAREGARVYLFGPDANPSPGALQHIERGAIAKVDQAYKCRMRRPWWRPPILSVPDLLLTYMDHERPRLTANHARVHHLNSLYGVTLRPEYRTLGIDLLPIACVNSVTILGAEMVGRAYGGGLLKLEPREADRLPLPSPDVLHAFGSELRALRPYVNKYLGQGNLAEAVKLVDRVVLVQACGLTHEQVKSLRESRATLFGRREARNRARDGRD